MKRACVVVLILLALSSVPFTIAQSLGQSRRDADIRRMMEGSVVSWNQGDLKAFAHCYKQADDILMVGPTNRRGYAAVVETYLKNYPNAAARGTLSYSDIEVQPLDRRFATVTGHFHLERSEDGGGNADGYYLLVLERTRSGWKIVRDDSALNPLPPRS